MLRNLLDPYEQRARLAAAMLVVMPIALVLAGLLWMADRTLLGAVVGVTAELGGPIALANHTRRVGKRIEADLWDSWGGPPTTRRLRHRNADNPHLLALVHASLSRIAPEVRLPTEQEERADPAEADRRYEAAGEVARNRLRDTSYGRLLFAENCSYGYHRNLLALRPIGVVSAVAATVAAIGMTIAAAVGLVSAPIAGLVLVMLVEVLLVLFWTKQVRAEQVEMAADSYVEAFMGAVAALPESEA